MEFFDVLIPHRALAAPRERSTPLVGERLADVTLDQLVLASQGHMTVTIDPQGLEEAYGGDDNFF